MVEPGAGDAEQTMTSEMRYYYRHREEKIARDLARYHNRPDVIAKKDERERKKAEKEAMTKAQQEAEKEAKRIEKERIRQAKLNMAEATKRKLKGKVDQNDLITSSPAGINHAKFFIPTQDRTNQ